MREVRTFGKRNPLYNEDKTRKKYLLIFEGEKTEIIYFKALNKKREFVGINPMIELVPVLRSFSEENFSNPKKLLQRVMQSLEEIKSGNISYRTLLDRIIAYMVDNNSVPDNVSNRFVWNIMREFCENTLNKKLDDVALNPEELCKDILNLVKDKLSLKSIISNISDIINYNEIIYSEDIDKICLIVDRDKESFFSCENNNQYEYVVNTCKKNGYKLYITNPLFEFWLLLHFDDVNKLEYDKILDNPKKSKNGKRYIEEELCKRLDGFKKSKYNADLLIENIDTAIENEKKYSENVIDLESKVGCNIGLLIEELRR